MHIGEEHAAREAGVSRPTLRIYEACPDHVKTPRCRWLLDSYYRGLATLLIEAAARRKMALEGNVPEAQPVAA